MRPSRSAMPCAMWLIVPASSPSSSCWRNSTAVSYLPWPIARALLGQHRHRPGHAPGEHHAADGRHQSPRRSARSAATAGGRTAPAPRRAIVAAPLPRAENRPRRRAAALRALVLAIREVQRERLVPADDVGRRLLLQAVAQLRRQGGGDDRPLARCRGRRAGSSRAPGDGAQLLHTFWSTRKPMATDAIGSGAYTGTTTSWEHAIAGEHGRAGPTVELRRSSVRRVSSGRHGCGLRHLARVDQQRFSATSVPTFAPMRARPVGNADGMVSRSHVATTPRRAKSPARMRTLLHQSLRSPRASNSRNARPPTFSDSEICARACWVLTRFHGGEHGRQHQEEQL